MHHIVYTGIWPFHKMALKHETESILIRPIPEMKNNGVFDLQVFQSFVFEFAELSTVQFLSVKSLHGFLVNSHISEKHGHFIHIEIPEVAILWYK